MAKDTTSKSGKSNKDDDTAAAGDAAAGTTPVAPAATPATSAKAHRPAKRFCIHSRNADDSMGALIGETDSPHIAYGKRCEGLIVLDKHHGNREYDGTVPEAAEIAARN